MQASIVSVAISLTYGLNVQLNAICYNCIASVFGGNGERI
jgi:hypothetical protein